MTTARGQSAPGHADYVLEWFDGDRGRGYTVRRAGEARSISWWDAREEDGLFVFNVVGEERREDALFDDSFAPGERVTLMPEPDNPVDPNAIAVYNEAETLHLGYVPKDDTGQVHNLLERGCQARSMWESIERAARSNVRIIAYAHDVTIRMDRSEPR